MRVGYRWIAAAVLVGCATIVGCSGGNQEELLPTWPIHGILTYQGQPMQHAIVIFHPKKKGLVAAAPRGTADERGHYQLTTFHTDDGAPEGDYKVTVYWPEKSLNGVKPEDADPLPADRLKNVYSDEKTTKLTATVSADKEEIDFKLPLE